MRSSNKDNNLDTRGVSAGNKTRGIEESEGVPFCVLL